MLITGFSFDAKLRRAEKHLHDLDEITRPAVEEGSYEIIFDPHPDPTCIQGRIVKLPKLDYGTIRLITSDCIHNIRSALDQLAFCLVVHNKGFDWVNKDIKRRRRIHFPIQRDGDSINEPEFQRKVDGMSYEAIEMIRELKPYRAGNYDLWLLNELDNIDKHQFVPISGLIAGWEVGPVELPDGDLDPSSWRPGQIPVTHAGKPVKENGVLLLTGLDPDRESNPKLFFHVAIHEPGTVNNQPLRHVISRLGIATVHTINLFRPMLSQSPPPANAA